MTKTEEILSKIIDDLYGLSDEEQNEFVLIIINGIQAKRRSDIDYLHEKANSKQSSFENLKEEVCNASNFTKL